MTEPLPSLEQGLGEPQSYGARCSADGLHPTHGQEAMSGLRMIPDRLSTSPSQLPTAATQPLGARPDILAPMKYLKYWTDRLANPLRGLKYAFMYDFAVRFEVFVFGIVGIPSMYFLFGPFRARDLLLLIFCWFFIVVTEIQNSAIEIALDKLHPQHDEAIGRSKDLASAAVVWAFVFGLVCCFFILSRKL